MTRNFVGARGIESIFTTTTSGTTSAFPLYDCHGNMVATVARNGAGFTTSNIRTYDVWGGVRTGATTGGPKGRYVANLGHVQDDESGLIYMRARFYEPETGRFISEDPARDGSNWIVYCSNDSINKADRDGQIQFTVNGFTFRFDANVGDLHIYKNGKEVFSRFASGASNHMAGNLTDEILETIIKTARAGNGNSLRLLGLLQQGMWSVDVERLSKLVAKSGKGALCIGAISTLDAYARYDPLDFADIILTIGLGGRSD